MSGCPPCPPCTPADAALDDMAALVRAGTLAALVFEEAPLAFIANNQPDCSLEASASRRAPAGRGRPRRTGGRYGAAHSLAAQLQ